jgi:hypothetical protein
MTEESTTPVISWDINKAAIAEVAEDFKDIDAYQDLDAAKVAKKTLSKMRTALGVAHKETKAEALAFGRKVDAKKNEYLALIKEIEDPISEQLDAIKNAELLKEEERLYAIEFQLDRLRAFANDRHSLDIDQLQARITDLTAETVNPDIYQEMLETAELTKEDGLMKLRITLQNEKERIEEEAKQAKVAAENAAKQKELDERQAKMDAEDAERKALKDKEDKARLAEDYKRNAEIKRKQDLKDEQQRKAQKKIDDENARIAQEKADKERKEQEEREADEAAERALAQAPDREKLLAYADRVDDLLTLPPVLTTDAAAEVLLQATSMLIEVAYDIRKMTEEMK